MPVSQYPLAQRHPPARRGWILCLEDARRWLALGTAGGGQEQAAGTGQPKSTEMLRNEAVHAKTDEESCMEMPLQLLGSYPPLLC